jgi:hypothetical protein
VWKTGEGVGARIWTQSRLVQALQVRRVLAHLLSSVTAVALELGGQREAESA